MRQQGPCSRRAPPWMHTEQSRCPFQPPPSHDGSGRVTGKWETSADGGLARTNVEKKSSSRMQRRALPYSRHCSQMVVAREPQSRPTSSTNIQGTGFPNPLTHIKTGPPHLALGFAADTRPHELFSVSTASMEFPPSPSDITMIGGVLGLHSCIFEANASTFLPPVVTLHSSHWARTISVTHYPAFSFCILSELPAFLLPLGYMLWRTRLQPVQECCKLHERWPRKGKRGKQTGRTEPVFI